MLDFFSANDKNTRLALKVLRRFLLLRTELFMWQGFYLLNYRVHDVYIIQQESFFRAVHAQHERSYVIIAKKIHFTNADRVHYYRKVFLMVYVVGRLRDHLMHWNLVYLMDG